MLFFRLARVAVVGASCLSACSSEPAPPAAAPSSPPRPVVAPQVGAASPSAPPTPPAAPAASPQAELLRAHNAVRAEVGTAPLTWSEPAAQAAKQHADRCKFAHSTGNTYGENLFMGTAGASTPTDVVTMWANEKKFYDARSGKCAGGECLHYTQVVWNKTTAVGCAKATCSGMDLWVCEYAPPGNFVGQRPY